MLLPTDIRPEASIYFNGAIVLSYLQKEQSANLFDLFHEVKKLRDMSFATFVLSLDWLYLLDIIILEQEEIRLCS